MVIIESLTALLIFALGILGLMAVMTVSVVAQSDGRTRGDAASLTNRMAQEIWLNADRSNNGINFETSLQAFQHNPDGDLASCDYTGGASASPIVADWVDDINTPPASQPPLLPGSVANFQQIVVNTGAGVDNFNRVTITVCWQGPNDVAPRRHTLVTLIN
jgi:hypothetical protein